LPNSAISALGQIVAYIRGFTVMRIKLMSDCGKQKASLKTA